MSTTAAGVSVLFDKYRVQLTLTDSMLGTNPLDPAILDTHILERQRKIIAEKSKINSQVNKYLDQIQISAEAGQEEVERLLAKLEEMLGYELLPEQRDLVLSGKLEDLKETFKELDTRGTTVFFWDKERDLPCIGRHMIYGYLKAAAESIGRTLPKKQGAILHSTAFTQSIINQHVKCAERFITADRDIQRREDGIPLYDQRSLRVVTAQGPRVTLAKSEVLPIGTRFDFTMLVLKNSPMTEDALRTLFSYGEHFTGLGQWRSSGRGQFTYEMDRIADEMELPKRQPSASKLPHSQISVQ